MNSCNRAGSNRSAGRLISRRSQMLELDQSVVGEMPGVPGVPNGAPPVRHAESSKRGDVQLSAGLSVEYFHVAGCWRDVGTTSLATAAPRAATAVSINRMMHQNGIV